MKFLTIIALMVSSIFFSFTKKQVKIYNNFDLQGHRGCRGLMPENTIAGMLKAIELGVNTLEMDVVITQDKDVVLSHEAFFNHEITTKPNGEFVDTAEEKRLNLFKMDYAIIKGYDVGLKNHPRFLQQQKIPAIKPLLSHVIDAVNDYCQNKHIANTIKYNIEIKSSPQTDGIYHPNVPQYCELVINVLKNKQQLKNVIIQSFDIRVLQYLHQKYPALKLAYLYEGEPSISLSKRLKNLGFKPTIYSPQYNHVTPVLVKYCHRNNIKVIPWTVNNLETMQQLKNMGVDGLISDYPNLYSSLK